jgi:FhuF 2Fe-2S C-terminal domain
VTWLAAGDLLAPGSADLDAQLKLAGETLGSDRPDVAASALLEGWAWTLARPLAAALAAGAPPPDLAAGNVRLRFAGGLVAGAAVRDPAPPDGGEAGAAARLLDGHLAVLVARLGERRVRRGRRALWGLVSNGCAAALLEEAHAAGLPADRAHRLLGRLLGPPGRPLPVPALLAVGPGQAARLVRRRVTCCLHYTVSAGPCATCPLLPPSETRRRLRDGLPGAPAPSPGEGGGRRPR